MTQGELQTSKLLMPKEISAEKKETGPEGKIYFLGKGLSFKRRFSKEEIHPFDELIFEKRDSKILDEKGNIVFEQKDVEVPQDWSQLATDIMASKYFRKKGLPGVGGETSAKQVVFRVAHTLREAGEKMGGYFKTEKDAQIFEDELTSLLINQKAAFNSPVWFNCGLYQQYGISGNGLNYYFDFAAGKVSETKNSYEHPQCSACFIQSISDDLMSIFNLVRSEAKLFKYGSGTGTNFSPLRGRMETLSGGGTSSGLMSFLEVFDKAAGATKSGGITRRAAKMVILDMDHPEIEDFIDWKAREERKAQILIESGLDSDFNAEAYKTVSGQNSNNSVRVTDEFMKLYLENGKWQTRLRTSGEIYKEYEARYLMDKITQAAFECADPGMQYDTTVNRWHTCKATERIYASNPCSEFMFLNDTACNLASINLVKFLKDDGKFDISSFKEAIRLLITVMDIIVDFASYPTEKIAQKSHDFRPLGLGYANLGTLLMLNGIPYDSEEGEAMAAAITAILNAKAYLTSAEIAKEKGSFFGFEKNREPMLEVMRMHRDAAYQISQDQIPSYLGKEAKLENDKMVEAGEKYGYRNAQATNIAPTGTIGLLMDCDTTGVEPDFALVKFKKLAGGGYFKIVNQSVPKALQKLGYSAEQIKEIINYAVGSKKLEDAPHINEKTLKEKGFTPEDILRANLALKGSFDIQLAFQAGVLGEGLLKRLGFGSQEYEDHNFNLLTALGFTPEQIEQANIIICGKGTIEGAPYLKEEHLPVFDCASRCGKYGTRFIDPMGHVKMMAAVQPFISGAISKTVNMPENSTVEDVKNIYLQGWKMGLKSLAIYRDGSKLSQPLSTSSGGATGKGQAKTEVVEKVVYKPMRRRLPDERRALTHKFKIGNHGGFITVGLYEDGSPGEVFITMNKEGSVIAGLVDSFAIAISYAMQYGVPLKVLVNKFAHTRFEPSGFTSNPQIRVAKSIVDYVFRWLALKFLPSKDWEKIGINHSPSENGQNSLSNNGSDDLTRWAQAISEENSSQTTISNDKNPNKPDILENTRNEISDSQVALSFDVQSDAPACDECGGMMVRSGTCYKCLNCGSTSGCS